MKRISRIILVLAVVLISCSKWSPSDLIMPKIPGFGTTGGNIEGTDFKFPAGIILDGEIRGYDPNSTKSYFNSNHNSKQAVDISLIEKKDTKASSEDTVLGSGRWVEVLLPLKNTTGAPVLVTLPAGLITQCNSSDYQNGLLIKAVSFYVPANDIYNVVLKMYCCNLSRHASSGAAVYSKLLVCTHPEIVALCDYFKNKAINYEDNHANYSSFITEIQSIVWALTERGEMPAGDRLNYINNLPNN